MGIVGKAITTIRGRFRWYGDSIFYLAIDSFLAFYLRSFRFLVVVFVRWCCGEGLFSRGRGWVGG